MRFESHDADRALFERFLDVVNRAIVEVRGRFPYSGMLGALQLELARRPFLLSITGNDDPQTELACVLDDFRFSWVPSIPTTPSARWTLQRDHLEDVIDEPWAYVVQPSLLQMAPFNLLGAPVVAPIRRPPTLRPEEAHVP
jgi:hypothetical protein